MKKVNGKFHDTKIMKTVIVIFLALCGVLITKPVVSDSLVIVTHPNNDNVLTVHDVYRLYFGKISSFPDGSSAVPVVLYKDESQLQAFTAGVLGRSTRQLRSYWARQIFTGKGNPPLEVNSVEKMKILVANNPHYVGYVWRQDLDDTVRVALEVIATE